MITVKINWTDIEKSYNDSPKDSWPKLMVKNSAKRLIEELNWIDDFVRTRKEDE